MKLLSLKCPGCGAKLEVNDSLKQFTCNFCGLTTMLDSEEIVVKNVTSKLQNIISELKDYYESGNYLKCYTIAIDVIQEYPKNEDILFYLDDYNCKLANVLDIVNKLEEKYTKTNNSIVRRELKNDIALISKYTKDYSENKKIANVKSIIYKYKDKSDMKEIIAITICIIIFLLSIFSFFYL